MNLYKVIGVSLSAVFLLAQTACLKDKVSNSDPKNSNNVVAFQNAELPSSYTSIYPQYNYSLIFHPDTAGFNINIEYAGAEATAPEDIKITLGIDTTALNAFNAQQSTNYIAPPTDLYSIPTTATIPKGQRQITI